MLIEKDREINLLKEENSNFKNLLNKITNDLDSIKKKLLNGKEKIFIN
jgi:hypothetical protein